jgi:hypothetical protein
MATRRLTRSHEFVVPIDQPLYAVPDEIDGQEVVRYLTTEEAADALSSAKSIAEAHALAGVWSDLDWDEMEEALDRIRHESKPTPPIDDL